MIWGWLCLAIASPPAVETEVPGDLPRWARVSELGVAHRAESLHQLEGDVSLRVSTPRPGAQHVDPDGRLIGRLGLGAGFQAEVQVDRTSEGVLRPGVGVGFQIFGNEAKTFQLGTVLQYLPEGFTEAEGEVELILDGTGRVGPLELTLNVVGGAETGLEGGDVEARIAAGYLLFDSLLLGVEGQSRFEIEGGALGEEQDHFGAVMAQAGVDNFVITGLLGAGARLTEGNALVGPFALARVEYRF